MLNAGKIVVAGAMVALACRAQTAQPLEFEVASIKPTASQGRGSSIRISNGSLSVKGATLKQLVVMCYGVLDFQVTGGPGWVAEDRFDLEAKSEAQPPAPSGKPLTDAQRKLIDDQFRERMRSMLADRFRLRVRGSTKEMPIYALVQAKGGAKLQSAKDPVNQGTHMSRGTMTATSSTMESLADSMAGTVGRPVVDQTGLAGKFDWKLEWTPDAGSLKPQVPGETQGAASLPEVSGSSIFTALVDQLGLKLEPRKGPAPVVVIEHVEKLSEN